MAIFPPDFSLMISCAFVQPSPTGYDFPGRSLVRFGSLLPLLVPGTVFAMGIQITLIRLGLSDTVAGVVLVHLVAAVPYCITIMTDVTRDVGTGLEEQAMVLGAGPVKAFFLTTFPSLLPGILSSMSMGFILSYSQYFTTPKLRTRRHRTFHGWIHIPNTGSARIRLPP